MHNGRVRTIYDIATEQLGNVVEELIFHLFHGPTDFGTQPKAA